MSGLGPCEKRVNSTADRRTRGGRASQDVYGSHNKLPQGYVTRGPDLAA
jgi:hypothetical protein